ncbi:PAS domain S-box protein [Methanoregula sp.]|uniref:hybrid sensor histidine kinase/response regulator n=1 Tax=Methanoregula sp. TaxID=2052170 RepID=UPI003C73539B
MYSVLYVDDEKLLLDLCRTYLEKTGDFTVDTTDSVPAALKKIKDTAYDAIVSDYQMPETDGLTFLKEIRSQSGDIPFILFTGKGREEIVIDAINNGADFYIQKGGAPDSQFAELAHKIRKAVERRKAIEDLRENESQLRLLKVSVDWASDDVYWLDFEGKILYANESACRNTGYSREEFLAMTVFDLDPDFTRGMWDRSKRILKERKTNIFTTRHRHKDGTIVDVEIMTNYVSKEGRDFSFAFARDITRRKLAEDALRESEERYQLLAESSLDGILVTDLEGRILTANHACLAMYEVDGTSGRLPLTVFDTVAPDSLDAARHDFFAMSPERKGTTRTYSAITARGRKLYIETLGNRITYKGEPANIISIRDVTCRHEMEERLRESEERYRRLIAQSFDAFIIHQEGTIVVANDAAARMVKANGPAEMIGRAALDFVDPAFCGVVRERIKIMSESPGTAVPLIEERFRCLDGTTVDVEVIATGTVFQGKPALQVVGRDISGRKRIEEALRAANRQLNLLNSITRHDILNKIMIMSCYLDLLKEREPSPETGEVLEKLVSNTRAIGEYIEFTKIYQDLGSTEPRWQELSQVLPHTIMPRGVILQADIDGLVVYADPILEKIFLNLLDNTLRHGKHATIIRVSARESQNGLNIFWEDDGPGIPAEEKEKIFRQGYGKNTGLGLFLTREILSMTGITIGETGEPGRGARFEIRVPKGGYRYSTVMDG